VPAQLDAAARSVGFRFHKTAIHYAPRPARWQAAPSGRDSTAV
jgi:hypothetical protein